MDLYETLANSMSPYIPELEKMVTRAKENALFIKPLIKMCILGCNMKRTCNFILLRKDKEKISSVELELALKELANYLKLFDIKTTITNNAKGDYLVSDISGLYFDIHIFVNLFIDKIKDIEFEIFSDEEKICCNTFVKNTNLEEFFYKKDWFNLKKLIPQAKVSRYFYDNKKEDLSKEDLLNTRIKIHDDFGRILLSTKAYVENYNNDKALVISRDEIISQWEEAISVLKRHTFKPLNLQPIEEIRQACKHLNMELKVKGTFPINENKLQIIMAGTRECMLNSAKQNAKTFCVDIKNKNGKHKITFTDDGQGAKYPIVLGGGLSSLKNLVENNGGKMTIANKGKFFVQIDL